MRAIVFPRDGLSWNGDDTHRVAPAEVRRPYGAVRTGTCVSVTDGSALINLELTEVAACNDWRHGVAMEVRETWLEIGGCVILVVAGGEETEQAVSRTPLERVAFECSSWMG
jgi:hypothetical protein